MAELDFKENTTMEFSLEIQDLLNQGRAAIMAEEVDLDTAESCYTKVFKGVGTESAEASFYVAFFLTHGKLAAKDLVKAVDYFSVMCVDVDKAIEQMPKEIRDDMGFHMFTAVSVTRQQIMEAAEEEHGEYSAMTRAIDKDLINCLKEVGELIIKTLGDEYSNIALRFWKETIYVRHTYCPYRNFQDKNKETWYDAIIKNIQKYDPSYKAPEFKQAGCVMAGEEARLASKVTPGE